jgi:hypothetical protein
MRFVSLAPVGPEIAEMEALYGRFDIGLDGLPTPSWVARNLKKFKPGQMFQHAFMPDVWVNGVLVNRLIVGALHQVYAEIGARWTLEARTAYGLTQYVKCYCFGDGDKPNLFWYGAAWRLRQQVGGEALSEVIKVFTRHGFTYCGSTDKKRLRDFEMW